MTESDWEKKINKIIKLYKHLSEVCDKAHAVGTLNPNGILFQVIWDTFDALLNEADFCGWISWFIWENDCGKRALSAKSTAQKKMKKVRTTKDLAKIIHTHQQYELKQK